MNDVLKLRLQTARQMLTVWVAHCDDNNIPSDVLWQGVQTLNTEVYNVRQLIEDSNNVE